MNKGKLKELRDFIIEHPHLIEMSNWVRFGGSGVLLKDKEDTSCGSVGCIAGLTVALHYKNGLTEKKVNELNSKVGAHTDFGGVGEKAIKILSLTREQAASLFFTDYWPQKFSSEESDLSGSIIDSQIFTGSWAVKRELKARKKYAKLVVKRIDYFLKEELD